MLKIEDISLVLNLYALVASVMLMIGILLSGGSRKMLSRLFLVMLVLNICGVLCELVSWYQIGPDIGGSRMVMEIAEYLSDIFGIAMSAAYAQYLYLVISEKAGNITRRPVYLVWGLNGLSVALCFFALFTHRYSMQVPQGGYYPRPNFFVSEFVPIIAQLVCMGMVVFYRASLTRRQRVSLLIYSFIPVICMVAESFYPAYSLSYVGSSLTFFIVYTNIQVELEVQLKEKEAELAENRIAIMMSQIQPHFLYNSLSAINDLCKRDPKQAQKAIVEFSGYLRGNLDSLAEKRPVPFTRELEHVKNYLSLEQKRFEERLQVVYEIEADGFFIPALSLQPIAENAVRHGLNKKDEGGTLTITTTEDEKSWHIVVKDDGVGFDPDAPPKQDGRSHVGFSNVKNRIESMCGGTVQVQSKPGEGTVVRIIIPKGAEQ